MPRPSFLRAAAGLVAFASGMATLMMDGLRDPTQPADLDLVPLGLVVLGLGLLGTLRPKRWLPSD